MKYTKAQKKFWSTVVVVFFFFSWFWFSLFKNQPIESGTLIVLVISQTLVLALVNWWGIRIVRRCDYRSYKYESRPKAFEPSSVDQWNTVERGVWGVTALFGGVPPIIGFVCSQF